MKKFFLIPVVAIALIGITLFLSPLAVHAQNPKPRLPGSPSDPASSNPVNAGTSTGAPGVFVPKQSSSNQATGFDLQVRLKNPLKVNTINEAIRYFVNAILKVALPFIVIFFIWSGFRFILARGNPTEVTKAKQMFWWTIVGTFLILGAWTITNVIIGTVNSITS